MPDLPDTAQYFTSIGDAVGYAMAYNARMAADLERARRSDPVYAHLYQDDERED